jgi:hypothetical protein
MDDYDKKSELQAVTKSGQPARDRVATIEAARAIYQKLSDDDTNDAFRRNRIRGQIDGKQPWDPTMMAEKGLGYVTNVNFLELRAVLDDRAFRRFSSYHEVPTLIRVRHNFKYDQTKPELPYGPTIEEEFTRMLREDWPGFDPMLDQAGRESDAFGFGLALFPDEWDWRPKAYPRSKFKFDPNAGLNPDELAVFTLDDSMSAGDLFRAIEDQERAADAGWNVARVRDLLIRMYWGDERPPADKGGLQGNLWESLEQAYRNNTAFYQNREFDKVEIVHLLYQEVDTRKVTHKIFSQLQNNRTERSGPIADGFLFEAPDRYENMSRALWLLPYNYGDGYLRSCRGIASYLEQHCDMSNRFLGRAFDAGMTSASLLVQPQTAMSKDKLSVVRAGILTVVSEGLNPIQQNFQPKIGDLLTLRRVSSDLVQNNTRETKDYAEDPAANNQPVSAAEVQDKAARAARGENQQTVFYSKHLQILYREMFRRMTNPDMLLNELDYPGKDTALLFVRRCVERGVPLELLLDYDKWRIMAVKPIGGGSPQARQNALNNLMQIRGELDERGRKEVIREFAAAQTSYEELERFVPHANRDEIGSNEHSIAALENAAFGSGIQIPVGSDQVHTIHFKSHAQQIVQMLQAVQEQGIEAVDPQRGAMYLGAAMPNMEGHLQYLQMDPTRKDFVKEGVQILQQATALYQMFVKYIEKMQAEQEKLQAEQAEQLKGSEQRALTAEAQVELAKAEMDAQVQALKVESLNAMRAQKTQEQLRIRAEQAAQDTQIKAQKAASDIAIAEAKAAADIEVKRGKSRSPQE